MKTPTNNPSIKVSDMLTEGQEKAIALARFQDTPHFILTDAKESIIYEGTEEEAREQFEEQAKDKEGIIDFYLFCADNLTVIEPIDGDEERDGYIVLTDEEADEMAKRYILDTVWAFNAGFLAGETGIDIEVFEAIQANDRCESNNDAILRLIDDTDSFVESAISTDGRGHFMSSYDGNENEENVNGTYYFIYRIN
jgi:hypothetical protein